MAEFPETIEVVARVPTEWSQDKALDGVRNALYAHPDIDFVFTSSDFLFPSLVAALKDAGKYHKVGQPGHVLLGGFDGDSTAYRMLADGYLDACGVQDVYYECSASIDALLRMHRGEAVEPIIRDPGFVIHQENLQAKAPQMWARRFPEPSRFMATADASSADASSAERRPASRVGRLLLQSPVWWLSLLLFLVVLPARPEMASAANVELLLLSSALLAVLSIGQTFVLITAGIDLSVPAVMSLASVAGAAVLAAIAPSAGDGLAILAAVAVMLSVGVVIGGAARVGRRPRQDARVPRHAGFIDRPRRSGGLGHAVRTHRRVRAVRGNLVWPSRRSPLAAGLGRRAGDRRPLRLEPDGDRTAAVRVGAQRRGCAISGVPIIRVTVFAYAVSGFCAGVAAVLYTARLYTGSPQLVENEILLDCIGAAVIGGTSLFGGRGRIGGTLLGAFFIALLGNSLNMLGLRYWHVIMVKGGVILFAAVLDVIRNRLRSGQ